MLSDSKYQEIFSEWKQTLTGCFLSFSPFSLLLKYKRIAFQLVFICLFSEKQGLKQMKCNKNNQSRKNKFEETGNIVSGCCLNVNSGGPSLLKLGVGFFFFLRELWS